jgi:HAD superfamily hydrolase (TIGR01549 family)
MHCSRGPIVLACHVMIQAVLWDIGGPINDETEQEALFDDSALAAARSLREVSAEEYVAICQRAVESFVPAAYKFIMWELAGHEIDVYQQIRDQVLASDFERFNVRPEIPDLLASLASRYKLGLAANSGEAMLDRLREHDLLQHFTSQKPGAVLGLAKPDVRYFLHVLEELGVQPENAVMVGDRIDCDVVPAKLLGMKAVLYRVGRHKNQQPRAPEEVPDAQIDNVTQLDKVVLQW